MMDMIGDSIKRKPLVDQWYKKPNGTKAHRDNSAILLGESETPDRWEHFAMELQDLLQENKLKEFFQKANRATQIKIQAQPLKGLILEDGTTIYDEEVIQRKLS